MLKYNQVTSSVRVLRLPIQQFVVETLIQHSPLCFPVFISVYFELLSG